MLRTAFTEGNLRCFILVDRLDEGYQHDTIGIGFVDGVIYALSDLDAAVDPVKTVVFLRDNIFRAIAVTDPDFSRNIEGQTLRLHWDTYQLFNLVCNRLRPAFALDIENNQRVWDRCTANELQRQDGFKRCLQLTLYRPGDILTLLTKPSTTLRDKSATRSFLPTLSLAQSIFLRAGLTIFTRSTKRSSQASLS